MIYQMIWQYKPT